MHDSAIETRTRLQLEEETEKQAQALEDLKLQREQERLARRQEMQWNDSQNKLRIQREEHDEQMRQSIKGKEIELETKRENYELQEAHQKAANREQAEYLKAMKDMEIDLTRYLVAQYQHPDRIIRIDGDAHPQLHINDK
jgi:hypothetical protein